MTETNATAAAPWHVKEYAMEKPTVTINKEHVINRQGKDFVLYQGLLDAAHRAGMTAIHTSLVQAPTSLNGGIAICHAVAEFPWGSYEGIGDADDQNVGRQIVQHKIRMAETRAKARALRDALNVGMAAVEELSGLPDEGGATSATSDAAAPSPTTTGSGAAPRRVAPAPPDRSERPAPVAARPVPAAPPTDKAAALDKHNRIRTTAIRLRDARKLTLDDALLAPFTEDATATDIEQASQRLLARINTAVQRPNGNGSGK